MNTHTTHGITKALGNVSINSVVVSCTPPPGPCTSHSVMFLHYGLYVDLSVPLTYSGVAFGKDQEDHKQYNNTTNC